MSYKHGARQPVAFVTGASGAGKTTALKDLEVRHVSRITVVQLDRMIEDTAALLDGELPPELRRFAPDPYKYDEWGTFLESSFNFEKVVRRFQAALPASSEALGYVIEGNHFFLPSVEEAVRFAVENKPDWRDRHVVIRKFMLDCDPAEVFERQSRAHRPKNFEQVNADVLRFRALMPGRGYDQYAVDTIVRAIQEFFVHG